MIFGMKIQIVAYLMILLSEIQMYFSKSNFRIFFFFLLCQVSCVILQFRVFHMGRHPCEFSDIAWWF